MGLKYYLRGLGVGIVVTALIMGIAAGVNSKEKLSDSEIRERAKELGMVEESTVLADTLAQGNGNSPQEEAMPSQTPEATAEPTQEPAPEATEEPASSPEAAAETPEQEPEAAATEKPTTAPTEKPTEKPTQKPTQAPTATPTQKPTQTPAPAPSQKPADTSEKAPAQAPEETPGTQEASSAGQSESVRIEVVSGDSSVTVCKKLAQAGLVESASEYDSYLCGNGYDKSIRAGVFEIPVDAGEKEIAEIITKTK